VVTRGGLIKEKGVEEAMPAVARSGSPTSCQADWPCMMHATQLRQSRSPSTWIFYFSEGTTKASPAFIIKSALSHRQVSRSSYTVCDITLFCLYIPHIPSPRQRTLTTSPIMGLLATVAAPLDRLLETLPTYQVVLLGFFAFCLLSVVLHVTRQFLFKDKNAPPEVFSWFPLIGNT